jgi:hypothetical protein
MRHRLRLYTGDDSECVAQDNRVPVRLSEIRRALADASRFNRAWLNDFEDEEVAISPDLYDVLSAYLHMRPGA